MHNYIKERISINENGCWVWQRALNNCGYGVTKYKGKSMGAHRLSYELHCDPVEKGIVVRHMCHNPGCVNPEHLTLGSQRDNYYDIPEERRVSMHKKSSETTKKTGALKGFIPWNKGLTKETDPRIRKQFQKD